MEQTRKPRIRFMRNGRYLVESFSRPGVGHQVDVLRLKCGCEAGSYGRRCKHLVLALEFDTWRRREQGKAQARMHAANWSSAPARAMGREGLRDV